MGRRSPTSISRTSRAGARLRTCSPATRPAASRRTLQSCLNCCSISKRRGVISMNHSTNSTAELDQIDDDFLYEVSDETLEAAADADIGGRAMVTVGPTILIGGCC